MAHVSRFPSTKRSGACCKPGSSSRSWFGLGQCRSCEPTCRPWRFLGNRTHARHGHGPWNGGYSFGSPRGSRRKRGGTRGGRTSKVYAVVDEHGRPRRFIITGGQVHDGQVLPDLLEGAGAPLAVIADKAYGSRAIRELIADDGALAVIPSKSIRERGMVTTFYHLRASLMRRLVR